MSKSKSVLEVQEILSWIKSNPTFTLSFFYLITCVVGFTYQWAYLIRFKLNVLNYSEVSDFLLFALKNPINLVYSFIFLGCLIYFSSRFKKIYIALSFLIFIFIFPLCVGAMSGWCAKQYVTHGEAKCGCLFPRAGQPAKFSLSLNNYDSLKTGNFLLSTNKYMIFANPILKDSTIKVDVVSFSDFVGKTKTID